MDILLIGVCVLIIIGVVLVCAAVVVAVRECLVYPCDPDEFNEMFERNINSDD